MPLIERPEDAPPIPCPRGFPQHFRVKRYEYPGKETPSIVICLDCKRETDRIRREKKRNGTYERTRKSRPSNAEVKFKQARVASILGAGVSSKQAAELTGYAESTIVGIKKKIEKDEFLLRQLNDARLAKAQTLIPKALDITDEILDRARERIDGYTDCVGTNKDGEAVYAKRIPGPRELAPILRETASVAGLRPIGMNPQDQPMRQNNVTINFNNPDVSRIALLALADWQKRLSDGKRMIQQSVDAEVIEK